MQALNDTFVESDTLVEKKQATDFYPTRKGVNVFLERVDPVVYDYHAKSHLGLGPQQVRFYDDNGFLVLPEVFSQQEIQRFNEELIYLGKDPKLQDKPELVREPDSQTLRSVFSVHKYSCLFDRLSKDKRILDRVTQLLGGDVYIYQSRVNLKPALDGKSFPWHSDFETWHAEDGMPRMRALSAWLMLTDNTEFNGPLHVIPGSHRHFIACAGQTPEDHYKSSLRKQAYGVPCARIISDLVEKYGMKGVYGPAGTLVLHDCNLVHGSPDNMAPWTRTNVFFVYNSMHNLPADKPFGADKLRPEFLSSRDFTPVRK